MTMQRTIKLYRLPTEPKTPGFRKLKIEDCPKAYTLLTEVCKKKIVGTKKKKACIK